MGYEAPFSNEDRSLIVQRMNQEQFNLTLAMLVGREQGHFVLTVKHEPAPTTLRATFPNFGIKWVYFLTSTSPIPVGWLVDP